MSIEHMTRIDEGGNVRLLQPKIVTQQRVAERMAARVGVETERVSLIDRVADSINNFFVDEAPAELAPAVIEAKPERVSIRERFSLKERAKKVGAFVGGVAVVFGGGLNVATAQSADTAPSPTTPVSAEPLSCIDDILGGEGVSTVTVDGTEYGVVTPEYGFNNPVVEFGDTTPSPNERLWSDSINTPLTGDTPQEKRDEWFRGLCSNPADIAVTGWVINNLNQLQGDGSDFHSEWDRFDVAPDELDEVAESYVRYSDRNFDDLTPDQQREVVDANQMMLADAERIRDYIERNMIFVGETVVMSGYNLGLGAEDLGDIPNFKLNGAYPGRFLRFILDDKRGGCEYEFLVNVDDRRATVVNCTPGQELPPELPPFVPETPPEAPEIPPETPDQPEEPTPPSTPPSTPPTTSPPTTSPPTTSPPTTSPPTTSPPTTSPPTTSPPTTSPPTTPPSTHPPQGPNDTIPPGVVIEISSSSNNPTASQNMYVNWVTEGLDTSTN